MNIRSKDVVDDAWESEFQVSAYFGAEIFAVLGPSSVSKGIEWAFPKPDEFWKTNDGADISYTNDFHKFMHKDGFRVIMIDYDQLPQGVREWREMEMREGNSKERKWIAVVDGKAFFSPGVVKFLQPLFATKDVELGENTCKGMFEKWLMKVTCCSCLPAYRRTHQLEQLPQQTPPQRG